MTCIVGLKHRDALYIAGDSATSKFMNLYRNATPKVFRIGDVIYGVSGTPRIQQIIQHRAEWQPDPKLSASDNMFDLTEVIRENVRKGDAENKGQDQMSYMPSNIVVGFWDCLFVVEGNYQYGMHRDCCVASGCGEHIALGALHVLPSNMNPLTKMKTALEASTYYNNGVEPPFYYVTTKKNQHEAVEL